MIDSNDFIEIIEVFTNKKLGKDFGFIYGTFAPFPMTGMTSFINKEGYILWKKVDGKVYECYITDYSTPQSFKLKQHIDFINNNLPQTINNN